MTRLPVSRARATLPELLDRVEAGDEVTITRHGRDVAVLVRPDALVARRADRALADADRLRSLLDEGRRTPLDRSPSIDAASAEELVASIAAARSAR